MYQALLTDVEKSAARAAMPGGGLSPADVLLEAIKVRKREKGGLEFPEAVVDRLLFRWPRNSRRSTTASGNSRPPFSRLRTLIASRRTSAGLSPPPGIAARAADFSTSVRRAWYITVHSREAVPGFHWTTTRWRTSCAKPR